MPLFLDGQDPRDAGATLSPERAPLGPQEQAAPQFAPSAINIGMAALSDSPVANFAEAGDVWSKQYRSNQFDPDFNPFEAAKGTWAEDNAEYLRGIPNRETFDQMIARGTDKLRNHQTLAAAGVPGLAASFAAGLIDPTLLAMPWGIGETAASGAARMAAMGALQSGVSEIALRTADPTRTNADSLHAIGSGAALMGVLGGAIGHLSASERAAMEVELDKSRGKAPDPGQVPAAAAPGYGASLSAASSDERTFTQRAGAFGDGTKWTQTQTVFANNEPETLSTYTDLASTSRRLEEHAEGQTSASPAGFHGAVEDNNLMWNKSLVARYHDMIEHAWEGHYYGDQSAPFAAKTRSDIRSMFGVQGNGKLERGAFGEAVTDALNNGDVHDVPEVQAAAQQIRGLVNEIADAAKTTKDVNGNPLLDPEAGAPKGAASFWPWLHDKAKIIARPQEFVDMVVRNLKQSQTEKAAAQQRISVINDSMQAAENRIGYLQSRIESRQARLDRVEQRADEMSRMNRFAYQRAAVSGDRAGDVQARIDNLQAFIDSSRNELKDPEQLARLEDLKKEVAQLRKEAAPMSASEEKRLSDQDIREQFPDELRRSAEIALGKRSPEETPSFLKWIAENGGIHDPGGDLMSALGKGQRIPGFGKGGKSKVIISRKEIELAKMEGRDLGDGAANDWAHRFREYAPELFPDGAPDDNEVLDMVTGALRGHEPGWWKQANRSHVNDIADSLGEAMRNFEHPPKDLRELAEGLKHGEPAVLQRLQEKAQAGLDLPGAEDDLSGRFAARRQLRDMIGDIIEKRQMEEARKSGVMAAGREGDVFWNKIRSRANELAGQAGGHQGELDKLSDWLAREEAHRDAMRSKLEEELAGWQGKSAAEVKRALDARKEAEAARQASMAAGTYKGSGARLTSADSSVSDAVKSILASHRDLSDDELRDVANQWKNQILGTPDGRLGYDLSRTSEGGFAPQEQYRGSLRGRETWIPYGDMKDWLVRDPDTAFASFVRSTAPDILLTQKFGDVEMKNQIQKIVEAYDRRIDALRSADMSEAEMQKQSQILQKQKEEDVRAVATVRDRIRGTFGWTPNMNQNLANFAKVFHNISSIQSLGTSVLNRFNDFGMQAVMRYGFETAFGDLWAPTFKALLTLDKEGWAKTAKELAADAGVGVDSVSGHMRYNLSDAMDYGMPGDKFVRATNWAADRSMLINMHSQWTDYMKVVNWAAAQGSFTRAAERIAAGEGTKADVALFAQANIPQHLIPRIAEQATSAEGHTIVGGRRLVDTSKWTDAEARQAFNQAMQREANIDVVSAGAGEKPALMSSPLGMLMFQFKGFVFGAHERIMISNLQQRDKNTLAGLVSAMAMGMLSYKLYSVAAGKPTSERPQDWIKEAVHRSAVLPLVMEANNLVSKGTAGRLDLGRLIGADRPLSRRTDNSLASEFMGPAWSLGEGAFSIAQHVAGGNVNAQDIANFRKIAAPMQNLMFLRILYDHVEDATANAFGIKPKDRELPKWQQAQ
jgi:hypothetical protein